MEWKIKLELKFEIESFEDCGLPYFLSNITEHLVPPDTKYISEETDIDLIIRGDQTERVWKMASLNYNDEGFVCKLRNYKCTIKDGLQTSMLKHNDKKPFECII